MLDDSPAFCCILFSAPAVAPPQFTLFQGSIDETGRAAHPDKLT